MSAAALFCVERELGDHPEPGEETRFLAVDRFHCGPGGAVHREQACQLPILMPGLKCPGEGRFVTLPRVLNRFGARGMEDRRHFFIRQALDTLIANVEARRKKSLASCIASASCPNCRRPTISFALPRYRVTALPRFLGFLGSLGFGTTVAMDRLQRQATPRLCRRGEKGRHLGTHRQGGRHAHREPGDRALADALREREMPHVLRGVIMHPPHDAAAGRIAAGRGRRAGTGLRLGPGPALKAPA